MAQYGYAPTTRYVHSPLGGILSQQPDAAGAWHWALVDGLGSVRGMVEDGFAVEGSRGFAPYGLPMDGAGSVTLPFAFPGEPRDGNGLQYHRARYYNPRVGVFPSLDPLEVGNRYAYVGGNVVNRVDPSGLIGEQPSDFDACGQRQALDCSCCSRNSNPFATYLCRNGQVICPCNNTSCVINVDDRTALHCKYDRHKAVAFAKTPHNIGDQFSQGLQCPSGGTVDMNIYDDKLPATTDCANFVSTALYVGGILQTVSQYLSDGRRYRPDSWFANPIGYSGQGDRGNQWKSAPPLFEFLTRGDVITDSSGNPFGFDQDFTKLRVGDLVFSGTNDHLSYGHVAIVTSIQGGVPYVVEHGLDYATFIARGAGVYEDEHRYDTIIGTHEYTFVHIPDTFNIRQMARVDRAGFTC